MEYRRGSGSSGAFNWRLNHLIPALALVVGFLTSAHASAAEPATPAGGVDLEQVKKKLGSGGGTEVKVVQNRLYSKDKRFELGLFFNRIGTDSFLSDNAVTASVGFHINEYWSIHALYWKDFVSSSDQLKTFERTTGFTANTNYPKSFLGGELQWSPIYGKLSLLNATIFHFDVHFTAGVGQRSTESGTYLAPIVGVGQQVFLSKWFSLRWDYRAFMFKETIPEKQNPSLGATAGDRNSINSSLNLGVAFLFP